MSRSNPPGETTVKDLDIPFPTFGFVTFILIRPLNRNDSRYGNLHSDVVHKLVDVITTSQPWLDDAKSSSSFRPTLYGILWHGVAFDDEVRSLTEGPATGRHVGKVTSHHDQRKWRLTTKSILYLKK
ncbi:hypothetical protein Fcan01_11620 [Folsomia candida]|uniref:Uncharacterized protein n=1 Tax=Folsomia candida TaxID=158441 RepID=A0A226EBP9_FOLCA|nr:hypothetical protein Fcan01_11620 [Folsomia candida]